MKKVISLLIAVCMVIAMGSTMAFADQKYPDMTADWSWAVPAVDRWSGYEVIQGSNIGFEPGKALTRAEAAAILSRLLKLEEEGDISKFTDVADMWYVSVLKKCVAAKILKGDGTLLRPDDPVKRVEFFLMFARALGIAPEDKLEKEVADFSSVPDWAVKEMNALINHGFVKGMGTNAKGEIILNPLDEINRASSMTLLDNTIVEYVTEDGAVVEATSDDQIIVIVANNVKVKGDANAAVVVAKKGATVDLSALEGTALVNIVADNVSLKNVPVGSTVSTTEDATGAKVNGSSFSKDTTKVIEKKQSSGGGAYVPEHTHSYTEPYYDADGKGFKCSCGAKQEENDMKFYLAVESGSTVDMVVYDDYSFVVKVPCGNVNANGATITAKMQNVASLGVTELREHSASISTGLGDVQPALGTWLSNAWGFGTEDEDTASNAAINITIGAFACSYKIYGNGATVNAATGQGEDAVIYGVPSDVDAVRAAWAELTSYITTDDNVPEDSYIHLDKDCELVVGDDKIVFENGAATTGLDLFKDGWSKDTLESTIRENVKLDTISKTDDICAIIGSGSTLALGGRKATLNLDCTMKVNGFASDADILDALTDIQSQSGLKNILKCLVEEVNNLMGDVQGKTIGVELTFDGPV